MKIKREINTIFSDIWKFNTRISLLTPPHTPTFYTVLFIITNESHEEIFVGPCESNLSTKNMAQHPPVWSSHPPPFHHCFIMTTVISIIKVKEHPILVKINNLWLQMISVKTIQNEQFMTSVFHSKN